MIVIIPSCVEHEGLYRSKYEISDNCPVCRKKRGKPYKGLSFDGSRRLEVDLWKNECGHVDKYSSVRKEGKLLPLTSSL